MPVNGSHDGGGIPDEGDVVTYERAFTVEDVREFGEVAGNQRAVQREPNEDGPLPVPELLTGSLMTNLGGELRYVARTIEYDFHRPVYTGESITCEWTVGSKTEEEDRFLLENTVVYRDEDDEIIGTGGTTGLVWK